MSKRVDLTPEQAAYLRELAGAAEIAQRELAAARGIMALGSGLTGGRVETVLDGPAPHILVSPNERDHGQDDK